MKFNRINVLILIIPIISFALPYKLGIENFKPDNELMHKGIALVTNQTGRDSHGNRTIDLLLKQNVNLKIIFVPEHGLDGKIAAEKEVFDGIDVKTKVSVASLYSHCSGKKIDVDMLKDIDVIMFDLQDSGMRHYTYISTLKHVLDACAEYNKKCIVFDRPNPLGSLMEGPLVDSDLLSFISIAPIPVRHGMTIGELAKYFNEKFLSKKADLDIIWMKNYDRRIGLAETMLSPLSPNIASLQSCYGYSFLGLLGEVRQIDVGFALQRPFQAILLPEKMLNKEQWTRLRLLLRDYGIETAFVKKQPTKNNQVYNGVVIRIKNIDSTPALQALFALCDFMKSSEISLELSPAFDKAMGTRNFREFLMGKISRADLVTTINTDLKKFHADAHDYFHYSPAPQIQLMK